MMMVSMNTIKIYINFLLERESFLFLRLIRSGVGGEETTLNYRTFSIFLCLFFILRFLNKQRRKFLCGSRGMRSSFIAVLTTPNPCTSWKELTRTSLPDLPVRVCAPQSANSLRQLFIPPGKLINILFMLRRAILAFLHHICLKAFFLDDFTFCPIVPL